MRNFLKTKRFIGIFIILMLFLLVFGGYKVKANSNGIGTIKDTYSREILEGVTYTYTESSNGKPQKNYVLEYNPKNADVEALAVYGKYAYGGDTLSSNVALAKSKGYTVIAGVNGSPFDTSNGVTIGTLISNGVIISASSGKSGYDSFAIKDDGSMFISTSNLTFKYNSNGQDINITHINKQKKEANTYVYLMTSDYYTDTTTLAASTEVVLAVQSGSVSIGKKLVAKVESVKNGATRTKIEEGKVVLVGSSIAALGNLSVGQEVTFDFINNDTNYDWSKVTQSICGFYEILKDGNPVNTSDPAVHPRTTIGFKADGTIVLYVVDGRQPGFSVGLTDLACAQYMKSLGCVAAIRMDGGGSSTMGLRLPGDTGMTTINSPSDGGERNDADGLLLVLKSDYDQSVGNETMLHAYPNSMILLQNTEVGITVKATDERYNPKATPAYDMEVIGGCGSITENNNFKAKAGTGTGKVKISSGNSETYVDIKVTDQVDELYANVNNLALSPNEKVNLSVKAYDNDSLLIASNESFTWTCSEGLGTIDKKGVFTASNSAGISGEIIVSYGNASARIVVNIGQLPIEITGFENDVCGSGVGEWQNKQLGAGTGIVSINEDLQYVRFGEKSLKIDFRLTGTTGTVGTQVYNGTKMKIDGTPTAIGMWVYATESARNAWIRLQYKESGSTGAKYADFGTIDWTGWKYLEAKLDTSVTYPVTIDYLIRIMAASDDNRIDGVIYIDQLRAVYGFTNDDLEKPIISNATPKENGATLTTAQTISCDITDTGSGVSKTNSKFYLDGKKMDNVLFQDIKDGFTLSWSPSSLTPLTKGVHVVKVRAEDNYGNFTIKEWRIYVDPELPEFFFEYDDEVTLGLENELELKVTSAINEYDLVLNYNKEEVEIIGVEGNGLHSVKDFKISEGSTRVKVIKGDENNGSLVVKYKVLVEGEVSIKVETLSYKCDAYSNVLLSQACENIVLVSKFEYDFTNFINNVNKLDENNVLSCLADLRLCVEELSAINRDYIRDQDALNALEKLDRCVSKYNETLEKIQDAIQKAETIGNLLGGK